MSEILSYFEGTGIRVLQDETIMIGTFISPEGKISGRNRAHSAFKILEGTEKIRPVIVLDHQPNAIDEAAENGVDLQLRTHPQRTAFSFNYIVGLATTHITVSSTKEPLKAVVSSWHLHLEIPG